MSSRSSTYSEDRSEEGIVVVTVNGHEVPERMVWEPNVSGKCRWASGGARPDHDGLASMTLVPGANHVKFRADPPASSGGQGGGSRSVHSAECCIFLWRYDDRVVVCDVDGTITRTDVIGFIGTIRGGTAVHEHTHPGVCSFMQGVHDDLGVKVLYLTSRPLRLVNQTKRFLQELRQMEPSPHPPPPPPPSRLPGRRNSSTADATPTIPAAQYMVPSESARRRRRRPRPGTESRLPAGPVLT